MDIGRYANERRKWGAQSEEDVAVAYVRLALGQKDPEQTFQMLLPAIRAAVRDVFRTQRVKAEERVPWDDLLARRPRGSTGTIGGTGRSTAMTGTNRHTSRAYLGTPHSSSTLDTINDLLKTHLWVWRAKPNGRPEGQMIPWAELTVDDIGPTVARTRSVIAGHERRISVLLKARALMDKYGVTCFGEIPFSTEVEELVTV